MPEQMTIYRCKICKQPFLTADLASACEARGPAQVWPQGLIFQVPGDAFARVIFAIAANDISGHSNRPQVLVARDDGGGDNTDWHAGLPAPHDVQFGYQPTIVVPNRSLRAFGRMVAYLEKKAITPTVWDGSRPVPLAPDWYDGVIVQER